MKHFLPAEILATSKELNIGIRIRIGGPRRLSRLRLKCSLRRAYQLPKPLWLAVTMNFRLCSVLFRAPSYANMYTLHIHTHMVSMERSSSLSGSPNLYIFLQASVYLREYSHKMVYRRRGSSSSASVTATRAKVCVYLSKPQV